MSGIDALPLIAVGLVIMLVVGFIGIGIIEQATTAIPAGVEHTVDDAFAWLPMIIMAILGGVALVAVMASAFAPFDYSPSSPKRPRAPEPVRFPATGSMRISWPEPTEDEIVARDPEIQAMNRNLQDIDAEIAVLRDARNKHLTDRKWSDRLLLWLKRRF